MEELKTPLFCHSLVQLSDGVSEATLLFASFRVAMEGLQKLWVSTSCCIQCNGQKTQMVLSSGSTQTQGLRYH